MTQYIVEQGEVRPLEDRHSDWHRRDNYGADWIVVDARDEDHALAQAGQYDAGTHPAQVEMDLFAAGYRAGALSLPGEEVFDPATLLSTQDVADALDVSTRHVRHLAARMGLGAAVGRALLFTAGDLAALRSRRTARGPVPRS